MHYVLDSSAAIAMLRNEADADIIAERVANGETIMHAINLYEAYYDTIRYAGIEVAASIRDDLESAGVVLVDDMRWELLKMAGETKIAFRMSLADTFVVALGSLTGATVLTSDLKEFAPVAVAGVCNIEFFR